MFLRLVKEDFKILLYIKRPVHVISQSQATCTVYGMPKAVVTAGLSDQVVPLDQIGHILHIMSQVLHSLVTHGTRHTLQRMRRPENLINGILPLRIRLQIICTNPWLTAITTRSSVSL